MAHAELVGPFPPGVDPGAYDRLRRRAWWSMPSGLYVLGSRAGDLRNLMTLNWAMQLALRPKLLGVSVEATALTHGLVRDGRCFTLSLLAREDRALVRRFVKPAVDDRGACTLNGVAYRDADVTGAPLPAAALAWLDCRLHQELDCGSHTLFVGEIVDAGWADQNADVGSAEERPAAGSATGAGSGAGNGAAGGSDAASVAEPGVLRMEDTRMSYGG